MQTNPEGKKIKPDCACYKKIIITPNIEKFKTCSKEASKPIRNKKRAAQNKPQLQQLEKDAKKTIVSLYICSRNITMKKGYKPITSSIVKSNRDKLITDTPEMLKTRKQPSQCR